MYLAASVQRTAFITQDLGVEPGVRRVRVSASFDNIYYFMTVFALFGHSSSEAILNLRVMDGAREIAHERTSLMRARAVIFGQEYLRGNRTLTLQCEFTRANPDDSANYQLIAELEVWAGAGGGGVASTFMRATLGRFQIYLHRR